MRMNRPTPGTLIVLHAFGRYSRGDVITDPAAIRAILDGGNSSLVLVPVMPSTGISSTSTPAVEH
jgi:hypothetical protein